MNKKLNKCCPVINRADAGVGGVANASIVISAIFFHLLHYTSNVEEQALLTERVLIKAPMELY